jgi:hypothetical protein
MACLFDTQNSLNPGDDFVRRRVRGFVQINDSVRDVIFQLSGQWRRATGDGGIVRRPHEQLVIVSQQQRPCGSVHFRRVGGGLDHVAHGGVRRRRISASYSPVRCLALFALIF